MEQNSIDNLKMNTSTDDVANDDNINIFSGLLNVGNVLEFKKKKQDEKRAKINEIEERKKSIQPLHLYKLPKIRLPKSLGNKTSFGLTARSGVGLTKIITENSI
jgi:hypothetical protein